MNKKFFVIAFCFGILSIFLPFNVKAKAIAQKCVYDANSGTIKQKNSIANSSFNLVFYNDKSMKGVITSWKGESRSNEEEPINWDSIKGNLNNNGKSANCPTHVILSKPQHTGGFFRVWAAYSEDEAYRLFEKNKDEGWGKIDVGIVTVTKSYNSEGINALATGSLLPPGATADEQSKCDYILGDPKIEGTMAWFLQKVLNYIKILGPILVVILSTLDFTKTILVADEKAMKGAQRKLFIRLGCAVGLFFLPLIANVLLNLINNSSKDWTCNLK